MPNISIPAVPALAETDLGNIVFSKLFGEGWWDITTRGADVFSGPLLPRIESLNWVLAGAVALLTLYNAMVAAVGTGSEGQVGGKNNTIWWPIRVIFGMGMTTPVAGGLSAFQILILSAVGWSMTFANSIWISQIENFATSNFSMINAEAPPQLRQEAQNLVKTVFSASLAQFYIQKSRQDVIAAEQKMGDPITVTPWDFTEPLAVDQHSSTMAPKWNQYGESIDIQEHVLKFATPPNEGLVPSDLGVMRIPGEPKDPLLIAKRNGIFAIYRIASKAALSVVHQQQPEKGWVVQATRAYLKKTQPIYENFSKYYPDLAITKKAQDFQEEAKALGWFSAGAFPLKMSKLSQDAREKTFSSVEIVPMAHDAVFKALDDPNYHIFSIVMLRGENNFLKEPDPLSPGRSIQESSLSGDPSIFRNILDSLAGRGMLQDLIYDLEESPVLTVSEYGHKFINTAMTLWGIGLVAAGAQGAAKAANTSITGQILGAFTGNTANAVVGGGLGATAYVMNWAGKLIVPLFSMGAVMAYLFPAMPLIYWVLAMCGFVLLVVEVLVAAPFWAAAHAWSTQDDGIAGEMGRKGYFQFLEILFRPPLYVIGFFMIYMVLGAMGWLVARLFETFYGSYFAADVGSMGLVGSLFMMILVCGLFIYLFYFLCSEGYSKLPRKVIRWKIGRAHV